jgi:hypothetical protein
VSANVSKDVLNSCLDGITLAMTANYELNQRRRDAIRPQFKPEFAKGLCSTTSPADEFLFGRDTAKRVKEWPSSTNTKCVKARPVFVDEVRDFTRMLREVFEAGQCVVEASAATVLSLVLVFISASIFRVCPSTSERPAATESPLATGMLTY